ncbi:MAG: hypothetical protein K6E10_07405 [Eubacterium sp.]|nr:hypothetical protein [Eubacterium sp.]
MKKNKTIKKITGFFLAFMLIMGSLIMTNPSDIRAEGQKKSIKGFLQTAMKPMGTTMYIYGGGWNEEDTGAGDEARSIGLSDKWAEFASQQTSSYNYKDYDYKKDVNVIHLGLDCSGFVGWALYNTLETEDGNAGYVDYYNRVLERLEREGYGTLTMASGVTDYKAGDIMKTASHVWIVIGSCQDGSVVLLHSSPPGVMLSGTATPDGTKNSQANTLATYYMKTYYSDWYSRYPDSSRGASYLSSYNQFRWTVSDAFADDEKYQSMNATEVLYDLFGSIPEGFDIYLSSENAKSSDSDNNSNQNSNSSVAKEEITGDGAMSTGSWEKDTKGWKFLRKNGETISLDWAKIDGVWYYFDKNSYMTTGWQKIDGVWYYMNSSGTMATGWVKSGNTWYYMNSSGAMATGWVKSGDTWYYMNSSGAMATGWIKSGDTWYYMNSSGAMATGWIQDGSDWYYLNNDGSMASNKYIGSYYLNSSGKWVK